MNYIMNYELYYELWIIVMKYIMNISYILIMNNIKQLWKVYNNIMNVKYIMSILYYEYNTIMKSIVNNFELFTPFLSFFYFLSYLYFFIFAVDRFELSNQRHEHCMLPITLYCLPFYIFIFI